MANAVSFFLTDLFGSPMTWWAASDFVWPVFHSKTGVARIAPPITNMGFGWYSFTPADTDLTASTVFRLDMPTGSYPKRLVGSLYNTGTPLGVLFLEDSTTGEPFAGTGAPTISLYKYPDGSNHSAPTLAAFLGSTSLYTFQPSDNDLEAGVSVQFTPPTFAVPLRPAMVLDREGVVVVPNNITAAVDAGTRPEDIAVRFLREWLLLQMPANVAGINLTRAAFLSTPGAGPFTIPAGAKLQVSVTGVDTGFVTVNLTSGGGIAAATLANDINTATGTNIASVDDVGRLLITSPTPPLAPSTNSLVAIGPDNLGTAGAPTGSNAALGWAEGGEKVVVTPIVAPGPSSVMDGFPMLMLPAQGQQMRIIIEDRSIAPATDNIRRNMYQVALDLAVLLPRNANEAQRSREPIETCLRAIRGCLFTKTGRMLGRAGYGDIQLCQEISSKVASKPFQFFGGPQGNPLFDVASMQLRITTFGRPAGSA